LEEGANTGRIASLWPSMKQSTIALEQLQKEMGLNVIQNTTFGALSNAELDMALKTALPTDLRPEALKDWMIRKKEAQQKLLGYVRNAASFLYSGGTMADWISEQQKMAELQETAQPTEQPASNEQTITTPSGTTVRVRRAR
jgi:hypothetical protein